MDSSAVALLISALSLTLAGLSLGWQVAQWLLSAGRPKATLLHGIVQGSGSYVGPVKAGQMHDLHHLRMQGFDGPEVLGVRVVNHGRAPVMISRVSVHVRGGSLTLTPHGELIGPALPHLLQPGTNENWFVSAQDAALLASSTRNVLNDDVRGVFMTAELGTGKTVKTPELLRI